MEWQPKYELGVSSMDETHKAFVSLLGEASDIAKASFPAYFDRLLAHTKEHFEAEKSLMQSSGFLSLREHEDDHDRVLAEMMQMQRFAARGMVKIARDYVTQKLPQWFEIHAASMDTALAIHLNEDKKTPI